MAGVTTVAVTELRGDSEIINSRTGAKDDAARMAGLINALAVPGSSTTSDLN